MGDIGQKLTFGDISRFRRLLGLKQGGFGVLALGNVFLNGDETNDVTLTVADWRNRGAFPIDFAILFLIGKLAMPIMPL